MRSRVSSVFVLTTALVLGPTWMAHAERLPKVEVCHLPPGNPDNAHTINVSENALGAHLRHGDFGVGEACSEGIGECRAEGTTQCDAEDHCSAVPGEPSDEICDGLDNDCDGVADNDPIDLGECTAGVGECAVDGFTVCTEDGSIACGATADPPPEAVEISCGDGRDNDCDGLIDVRDPDCLIGDTPVGVITADITRGGSPPGSDRGVESAAVNLAADAQLWATSANGAEIAFMNPGGVRSDLTFVQSQTPPEGDGVVTYGEAFTFQPFGNTLITYPMTGAQIVSVLQEQCQPAWSSRPFLHLGVSAGFTYDLAKTIVAGSCASVTVSNVLLNGVALNPAATYMVTVNSFLADGGDNFATFGTITAPRLDGGNDLLALLNYLGTFSPVAPPSTGRVNELP